MRPQPATHLCDTFTSPTRGPVRRVARSCMQGFTLVEVLIVVVILGILASIVMAQVGNASGDAKKTAFVSSLKTFARAANVFIANESAMLPDVDTGTLDFEGDEEFDLTEYFKPEMWTAQTPLGGHWDIAADSYGFRSLLGVHFDNTDPPADAFMSELDAIIDDGDLNDGSFRKMADDRFYMVIRY